MTQFQLRTDSFVLLCLFLFLSVKCQETSNLNQSSTASSIMNIASSPKATTSSSIQHIPAVVTSDDSIPFSEAASTSTTETPYKVTNSFTTTVSPNTTTMLTSTTTSSFPTTTMLSSTAKIEIYDKCPELSLLPDLDLLTQDEFTIKLTDNCRYDRLIKPPTREPLEVLFQFDMNHVESAEHLQLKADILVQLLYTDNRLAYSHISPKRGIILGEESLRDRIWVPHIIIANERESNLMGLDGKDVLVQISPNGDVIYSYRMSTMFYCWMNLKKFPFDHQTCDIRWVSWAYNVSNMVLKWEENRPYLVGTNLHLTEFVLENTWIEETVVPPAFDRGGLVGNYSSVVFKFLLRREIGFYIMDYYVPSILLVCTSWVTFWLQADAAAPRVTLGTATMLSFITLNGALTKNLPKVSYIKASEIWFLTCASFIFFSLAEFAFVNVIWRRRKKVELKKQNSKHILKGALTPSLARRQLRKAESMNTLYKTRSCSSLDRDQAAKNSQNNYLTVHSFPIPKITNYSQDELLDKNGDSIISIPDVENKIPNNPTWTTMTPQEVAMWIDKKSRVVFPVAFCIFNLFYWSFVYAL